MLRSQTKRAPRHAALAVALVLAAMALVPANAHAEDQFVRRTGFFRDAAVAVVRATDANSGETVGYLALGLSRGIGVEDDTAEITTSVFDVVFCDGRNGACVFARGISEFDFENNGSVAHVDADAPNIGHLALTWRIDSYRDPVGTVIVGGPYCARGGHPNWSVEMSTLYVSSTVVGGSEGRARVDGTLDDLSLDDQILSSGFRCGSVFREVSGNTVIGTTSD